MTPHALQATAVKVAEEGADALDTKVRELAVTASGSDLCYPFIDTWVCRAINSEASLFLKRQLLLLLSLFSCVQLCATP